MCRRRRGGAVRRERWKRKSSSVAAQALLVKLSFAFRSGLAAFLATGLSFLYLWSSGLTWFSVTLSIAGVRRSLGETLLGAGEYWYGAALVSVPLIYLLSLVAFSKV
jgi:hypothetical protein